MNTGGIAFYGGNVELPIFASLDALYFMKKPGYNEWSSRGERKYAPAMMYLGTLESRPSIPHKLTMLFSLSGCKPDTQAAARLMAYYLHFANMPEIERHKAAYTYAMNILAGEKKKGDENGLL